MLPLPYATTIRELKMSEPTISFLAIMKSLKKCKQMDDPQWLELLMGCVATDYVVIYVVVLLQFLWCVLFR